MSMGIFSPSVYAATRPDQTINQFLQINRISCLNGSDDPDTTICGNFAFTSCKDEDSDDGTGINLSQRSYQKHLDKIGEESKSIFRAKIRDLLKAKLSPDPEKNSEILADKELAHYFGKATVISKHNSIEDDADYKKTVAEAKIELSDRLTLKKEKDRVEDIFPKVKRILIQKINFLVKDRARAKQMTDKIEQIKLAGTSCANLTRDPVSAQLSQTGTTYDQFTGSFTYCNGMLLQSNSVFAMVFTIAHELAHSIDPCMLDGYNGASEDHESSYPVNGLIGCLRSKESVYARKLDTTNFCNHDQITESVADWFAAEALPEYISKFYPKLSSTQKATGYSNALREVCVLSKIYRHNVQLDEHPLAEDRINRILMANPSIRTQLGCAPVQPGLVYCRGD
jgi:hypothetical protein